MKTRALFVVGFAIAAMSSGCAINGGSSLPRADAHYATMAANARTYQKTDGNLSADYAVDLLLNGSRARDEKPVMALSQSNPR